MSGTEGQDPGGTDPIDLQLPREATGSSREQATQSTAPVTCLIDTKSLKEVTPYHGVKASFLSCLQCEQLSDHFMKDSRKLRTTRIRISENPDCPLKVWNFQIRCTHC